MPRPRFGKPAKIIAACFLIAAGFGAGYLLLADHNAPATDRPTNAGSLPTTASAPATHSGGVADIVPGKMETQCVPLQNARAIMVAVLVKAAAEADGGLTVSVKVEERTNSVLVSGEERQVNKVLDSIMPLIGRMEATPGIATATRFAEDWQDHVAVTHTGARQAAMMVDALSKGTTEAWRAVHAVADETNNRIDLYGSAEQQVKAAKAFIEEADANNRWATLESEAFDGAFFILHLTTVKAADVAATMSARYTNRMALKTPDGTTTMPHIVSQATFVSDTASNALLVTCRLRDADKIKAEVAALDRTAEAPTKPAGDMP
jgi:type II secretory pathway component GspD/PulD (secretin)